MNQATKIKMALAKAGVTHYKLAELMTERGIKMSQNNLSQRLKRNGLNEDELQVIADILGCKFESWSFTFDDGTRLC